ncbi:uncharacterized protein SCHCODRAFT_02736037 [Schizophyllum commune H4-8]|uniref:uncharacterized protein n=1 Tax=Schizophyllum commune (strain H4-8 / FGSC 9210) TaxID=578458 RepID=UPI00215DFAF0|nr:uncharacterized protein SCHCODRAFT_02736037 [Schizophyllum commune H4-8]KAI5891774.1 hypothetical protein SCHCODRAFT_02736037 [Schizophyllum commune H4-8]
MSTSVVGTGRQPAATHTHSPRTWPARSRANNEDDAGNLEAVDRNRIPTSPSLAPRDPTIARDEPNAGGLAVYGALSPCDDSVSIERDTTRLPSNCAHCSPHHASTIVSEEVQQAARPRQEVYAGRGGSQLGSVSDDCPVKGCKRFQTLAAFPLTTRQTRRVVAVR